MTEPSPENRALLAELEDFFVDLRGTFNDARAQDAPSVISAIGSRFEAKVLDFAERLEALSGGYDDAGPYADKRITRPHAENRIDPRDALPPEKIVEVRPTDFHRDLLRRVCVDLGLDPALADNTKWVGPARQPATLPGVAVEGIETGQEITYDPATGHVRLRRA